MIAKQVFASVVLALSAGFAMADDIKLNAGSITTDTTNPYYHLFVHEKGTFTDTIDFTIPSGSLGTVANSLWVALGDVSLYDITNLTYTVFGGTSAAPGAKYGTFLGDNTTHDIPLTMGGAYHLIVTGSATGNGGGAYGVGLVSSVPEAETYTMLLGGMALLGVVARRRQKRS
jgi:hypothetical protein